jgi:hypothetical protein
MHQKEIKLHGWYDDGNVSSTVITRKDLNILLEFCYHLYNEINTIKLDINNRKIINDFNIITININELNNHWTYEIYNMFIIYSNIHPNSSNNNIKWSNQYLILLQNWIKSLIHQNNIYHEKFHIPYYIVNDNINSLINKKLNKKSNSNNNSSNNTKVLFTALELITLQKFIYEIITDNLSMEILIEKSNNNSNVNSDIHYSNTNMLTKQNSINNVASMKEITKSKSFVRQVNNLHKENSMQKLKLPSSSVEDNNINNEQNRGQRENINESFMSPINTPQIRMIQRNDNSRSPIIDFAPRQVSNRNNIFDGQNIPSPNRISSTSNDIVSPTDIVLNSSFRQSPANINKNGYSSSKRKNNDLLNGDLL